MRILQICSARDIGGGERHLADLANALARQGHAVFAALSPSSPVRAELSEISSDRIFELPMRNALNLRSAMKLWRYVRENRIDIVHAHIARDYPLAALATGRSQARLVLTRHVLFPLNRIHKLTLRRTARVIAVSQAVAEAVQAQVIFAPEIIRVIHNGIDIDRFAHASELSNRGASKLRVGTIGHLHPIKGHEDFIRAAEIVCGQRADVEFVIAGEDKSRGGENRRQLEKLIVEAGLDRHVRLPGWIDDVTNLLPTLDIFVSAAHAEPFGLSILEAMAASVPVIATASEGAREIIEAGETGRLLPVGDAERMAQAIIELLDNDEERTRLARKAHAVARERFSIERMVTETEQVYAEAISR